MTAKILRPEVRLDKLQVFKFNVNVESLYINISINRVPLYGNFKLLDRREYLENIMSNQYSHNSLP